MAMVACATRPPWMIARWALARLTPRDALRAEADVEAVLMAMGSVTRPGPRVNLAPQVLDA